MVKQVDSLKSARLQAVRFGEGFWGDRLQTNRTVTLPAVQHQSDITGRFAAWKLDWQPGDPNKPHYFWDSDGAKWIEAAAYSLATHPDAQLEAQVDAIIDLIAQAQHADGYLNIYFTVVEPEKRWQNLRDWHELYCAGHLIEAAVAYFEATGKRQLLDVMCRYVDYIATLFGPNEGQKRGYPGHQEIELALVKLYRITGAAQYLALSQFFIDERGQQPHYFDTEALARGERLADYWAKTHQYTQSHLPVREQREPVGHAVRACYLYAGMADVALETGDTALAAACKRIWENLTATQMYITGGIGPTYLNEGFTTAYDLPNETAYAETCAAIALVFWAQRMFQLDPDSRYTDVIERALYNGVLSGVSQLGDRFFYANPLAAQPHVHPYNPRHALAHPDYMHYQREEWFDCACCPPNLARLLASLGQYVYSTGPDTIYVHLYAASSLESAVNGQVIKVEQRTNYPWDEQVQIVVQADQPAQFTLSLRVPGWCGEPSIAVNGDSIDAPVHKGYATIEREWQPGDQVLLNLPMPVERVQAHPKVWANVGQVALQRGPIVYCLEEVDNGPDLASIVLPNDVELRADFDADLLGGITVVTGTALRSTSSTTDLYQSAAAVNSAVPFSLRAIPYALWANREPGEMRVWIQAGT